MICLFFCQRLSVGRSASLAVRLSVSLYVSVFSLPVLSLSVCLSISVSVSVSLSMSLSACLSVSLVLSVSVSLSLSVSVSLSMSLSVCLSLSLSVCTRVCIVYVRAFMYFCAGVCAGMPGCMSAFLAQAVVSYPLHILPLYHPYHRISSTPFQSTSAGEPPRWPSG